MIQKEIKPEKRSVKRQSTREAATIIKKKMMNFRQYLFMSGIFSGRLEFDKKQENIREEKCIASLHDKSRADSEIIAGGIIMSKLKIIPFIP